MMEVLQVEKYDSATDTLRHVARVRDRLNEVVQVLLERGAVHDQSKLAEPEKSVFDTMTPLLKTLVYGSPEYKESLKQLGPALQHHYENNSHHPEHYPAGVAGMDLFDLVEMFCDWAAACERTANGDMLSSLTHNAVRFNLDPQLIAILANTIARWPTALPGSKQTK